MALHRNLVFCLVLSFLLLQAAAQDAQGSPSPDCNGSPLTPLTPPVYPCLSLYLRGGGGTPMAGYCLMLLEFARLLTLLPTPSKSHTWRPVLLTLLRPILLPTCQHPPLPFALGDPTGAVEEIEDTDESLEATSPAPKGRHSRMRRW